jgi:hypothetical protein
MTSKQLLQSWDKSKKVFANRTVAWLTLHRICSAGAEGTNLAQIGKVAGTPSQATLEDWIAGGLITKHVNKRDRLSPTITYHATEKAYQLLRVQAPQTTEN